MKNLGLSETEYIILKKEYSNDGKHDGEFYITNENIIFSYEEGIFNTKNLSYKISLSSIKKRNGEYQVFYNEDSENMEIYYIDGQCESGFDSEDDTEDVIDALKKILKQSTMCENKDNEQHNNDLSGNIYCPSCGAKNQKNAKFCNECGKSITIENEITNVKSNFSNNVNVSVFKCKGCGATIKGNIGEKVKCEYCDLIQNL